MRYLLLSSIVLLSCGGTSSTPGTGGGGGGTSSGSSSASLNGDWDITSVGGEAPGPSQMTVTGDSVTGAIVDTDEGAAVSGKPGCTWSKYRTEFTVSAQSNALSGTVTSIREMTGASCDKPDQTQASITGTRTKTAIATDTDLNGEWEVIAGDSQPFIVTIDGLSARGVDKAAQARGKSPNVTVSIAGGVITLASDKRYLQFAARHR
jgi:hypothetical protein